MQAGPVNVRYLDAWRSVYVEHGLRGFYRGYLPVLCANSVFFCMLLKKKRNFQTCSLMTQECRFRAVPVNASAYFVIEYVNEALMRIRRRSRDWLS